MAERLIWNTTLRAEAGPQLIGSGVIEVEAYDKVSILVPAGGHLDVDLGPGAAGRITVLAIVPAEPSVDLTYDVGGTAIALDEPQFLYGGAVELTTNPATLAFANASAADAAVELLVGRDATP
ncbi:hypothetical protein [uncultured Microbacterium sp.]|uniref:hypothetical protein n=1 Tax=uncultured Microbacterium sp. TaxID=191216 RepID=UPI002622EB3F|nr:hypothetical protein [uncultured Microbacterium sp.]